MTKYNRMNTSKFRPREGAEPSRKPRVRKTVDPVPPTPSVDERTAFAALEILENMSLIHVVKRLRSEALAEFANSKPGSEGFLEREKAHLKLTVVDEMEASIRSMADQTKFIRKNAD